MRARVRDIPEGTRAEAGGHEDVFVSIMRVDVGKVIQVVPDRMNPKWFVDEYEFCYHPDWLDFDTVSDTEEQEFKRPLPPLNDGWTEQYPGSDTEEG